MSAGYSETKNQFLYTQQQKQQLSTICNKSRTTVKHFYNRTNYFFPLLFISVFLHMQSDTFQKPHTCVFNAVANFDVTDLCSNFAVQHL